MKIAIDFDQTIALDDFPDIGEPVPGAIDTILRLKADGHQLILWTVRSGDRLQQAIEWLEKHNIGSGVWWDINKNPDQKKFSDSPKAHANLFIDDKGAGCPLIHSVDRKPCVDWSKMKMIIKEAIERKRREV